MSVWRLKSFYREADLRWTKVMLLSKDDSNIMKAFGFVAIELGDNQSFLLPYFRGVGLGRCEGDQRRDNDRIHGVAWQFEHTRSEERRVGKECRSRWSP